MDASLTSVAVVAAVALLAPLALALTGLGLPAIVLEILLGIVIGPQVLGWAEVDEPARVLALVGLAFLLFLSGTELDLRRLRGRVLRLSCIGFALSAGLGIILPILKDAGETETALGRIVIAGASIAEVAPIVLLSLFFSGRSGGAGGKLVLLVAFVAFVVAVAAAIVGLERSRRVSDALLRLQDTSAQIRVRGAFLLLTLFVVFASRFGLEAILGAFFAGATLRLVDRDETMTHTFLQAKLEAAGFGIFIPFFFVSTGMKLDVRSLFEHGSTLARVPIFLAALLIVRGLPALVYRPLADRRGQVMAAGLLQATSLSIPVVAGQIGLSLGLISAQSYVALVTAGLLSVIVFPLVALPLLAERGSLPPATDARLQPGA